MRICQVLAGNEDGGLEKHTIELSKQLALRGYSVYVIAHKDFEYQFSNVTFIPLDLTKSRNNILVLFNLYKILKNFNFDIVHTQANKATAMVAKIKPFIKNSKFISTLHGYKKNLKAFEKSDFVITVSNKISQNLKNPNKKTIYNGVHFSNNNLQKDLYEYYNIDKTKFIICSVARLTKVKRFDILINSMKSLNDVHLILVGNGIEEKNLKELSNDLSLNDRITFTGNLENTKVKEVISSSSLFVMTSDNEGFPYTFVEAMFCNTPFISTPVSDMTKILGKKYIINFNSVESTIEKIKYVKENYANTLEDFDDIFRFSEKKFTIDNMVSETIEVYDKILKKRNRNSND